jgi:thiol-disulfide isomerase/thioredoxin
VTRRAVVGAAAALLAAAAVAACGGSTDAASEVPLGKVATREPSAEPVEASGTDPITGATVSLADYAGQPIVLNFWASWCPPCREELPTLEEFWTSNDKVVLVGVNFQDSPSAARKIQQQTGFTFPSIEDRSGELGQELGIIGMPTTFFLDRDHRIVGVVAGPVTEEILAEGAELVSGET